MTRSIAAVLYWVAAITIALGAFGHGFLGVKPVEAAIGASTLAPDIVRVIWIVWYWVSGSMVVCGAVLFWAWPGLRQGSPSRVGAVLIVGLFYFVAGAACFAYSGHDPFWLLFVTQGVIVISAALTLRGAGR